MHRNTHFPTQKQKKNLERDSPSQTHHRWGGDITPSPQTIPNILGTCGASTCPQIQILDPSLTRIAIFISISFLVVVVFVVHYAGKTLCCLILLIACCYYFIPHPLYRLSTDLDSFR